MKLRTILNISLAIGLFSPTYGVFTATSCSAEPLLPTSATKDTVAELDPASQRVEQAKLKLDQARQQLSAAKAMLKAAEAEFKATRADRDALSARNEAQKLADASGLKDDGVQAVQPTAAMAPVNRLYPVTQGAVPDLSTTRIQTDFNAPVKADGDLGLAAKSTVDGALVPNLRANPASVNAGSDQQPGLVP